MTTLKTPDVYVKEISIFPPSVAEVETAIPAFIGCTQMAKEKKEGDLRLKPTRIKSMAEYQQYFGTSDAMPFEVNLAENSDGSEISANPIEAPDLTYKMYYSMRMFFANGGGPCYIVSVDDMTNGIKKGKIAEGLSALEKEDEPTLILMPDATSLSNEAGFFEVMNAALVQCSKLQDRFTILDIYKDTSDFRNGITSDLGYVKYGAAYHPSIETSLNFLYEEKTVVIKTHVKDDGSAAATDLTGKNLGSDEIKAQKNALYNKIIEELLKIRVTLPPGPAIAGVYARVDNSRGVWKAPANVSLMNVVKPIEKITNEDQESLNVDVVAGKSINAIRAFTGKGTMVWGARTLAGNDNEWRYVSVRRFFNMVEESVKKSTYWAVFEPNDANTWLKVRAMIENYLTQKWRDGALQGSTPDKAFFVKVGLGTTMTALDILEGRMNVEIGMAAVRPAEFIILKFSHKMPEA